MNSTRGPVAALAFDSIMQDKRDVNGFRLPRGAGTALVLFAASTLVACGGGGGGGGGVEPVVYTGNTSAAVISPLNASKLVGNLMGSQATAATIVEPTGGGAATGQRRALDAAMLVPRLQSSLRARVLPLGAPRAWPQAVQIDETAPCDNGVGFIRTAGTLSDAYTGTVTMTFGGCLSGTTTLDGEATLTISAFNMGWGMPTDVSLSFARLTIRGPNVSIDSGGSLRLQIDPSTSTETLTSNLVTRDNIAATESKSENLAIVSAPGNFNMPGSITASVNGRIYDQLHGYVDASTLVPLLFQSADQLFPLSGQLMLAGAPNHRIRATALSATVVRLELDLAGQGFPIDGSAVVRWAELSSPSGADLGDDDDDGLHNSWETANGLNPQSAGDAATDADGDGTTNIREYYAGADPHLAGQVAPIESTVYPAAFFASAVAYTAGTNPTAVAVGDFNQDGKTDLAVTNWNDNTVSVLLGNGAGAFGAPAGFAVGLNPTSVIVGDFNGDGKPDLAVANYGGASVSVLLGNGSGGFGAPTSVALTPQMNPTAVATGDFNGDGRLDLAVTVGYGGNVTPGHVAVLLGDGVGGFGAPANVAVGGTPSAVGAGDFNGDGKLDLAVTNSLVGTVSVLLGDGTGAFASAPDVVVAERLGSLVVGDFNRDGKADLAVTVNPYVTNEASVAILTGTGAGTFAPAARFVLDRATGATLTSLALADFNGDGKIDLAVSDQPSARAFVLFGDGAGSFGTVNYVVALGHAPIALAVGHFNGDARPDLVAASFDGSGPAIAAICLNTLP